MNPVVTLVKGQNAPWSHPGLVVEILCATGHPECDVSALLVGADQRVSSSDGFVFYNQPAAGGVTLDSAPGHRLRIDLGTVTAHAVLCLVSVDPGSPPLGRHEPMTVVLTEPEGAEVARFDLRGLTDERAVIAVEVYRRDGAWRVRAVGQGYTGGLREAVTAHGVEVDQPTAPSAKPPPGITDQERLIRQAASIFEDAARSTASLRSSVDYADRKRAGALEQSVADPATRAGSAGQAAAVAAQVEYDRLVRAAQANHQRDMAQLQEELAMYTAGLPASMAPWDSLAWQGWRAASEHGLAVRVGELHVDEAPAVALPMLLGVPFSRPVWVDTSSDPGGHAQRMVRSLVARMLAAYPPGDLRVYVVDLGGGLASALAPLARPGSRVMPSPAATTLTAMRELLDDVVRRVDLVQMARGGGALDVLAGDTADRLLVLDDFSTAFDDAAVGMVRHLVDEGRNAGVQLLLTGEMSPVAGGGPLVPAIFRESARLPVVPDDHIADGWTGTVWNFTPDLGPDDSHVVDVVLERAG